MRMLLPLSLPSLIVAATRVAGQFQSGGPKVTVRVEWSSSGSRLDSDTVDV